MTTMTHTFFALVLLWRFTVVSSYFLMDNYVGKDFLSSWVHEAIEDPTHGRVNYVDQGTALSQNLTFASDSTLVIRADFTTVLSPSGPGRNPGRNSVRIRSKKSYTQHIAVFDIRHMPQGCATWPAAWETSQTDWPNFGEVDVIEGVNDAAPNQSTLHTSDGCTMPAARAQQGTVNGDDCSGYVPTNPGCGVRSGKASSFGPAFNAVGGGWYAMQRTSDLIRVFFWARHEQGVPGDVVSGAEQVNPDNWGEPVALFPNTSCDIDGKFGPNNIIINLTLCGDWAGDSAVYNGAGCPGNCVDLVNNNPAAFTDAYWNVGAVRVYVPGSP